jgi:hypothetical protein
MRLSSVAEAQQIELIGAEGVQGVQEFRSSGVQEFRSSGVQEFRSSGVQEFRSSAWVPGPHCKPKLLRARK